MKLGYFTLTDNPPAYGADRKDPSRLLEEVMAQCIHAEEVGLNSVWVPISTSLIPGRSLGRNRSH